MKPLLSIIVVCLNPGEKLKQTLDSILSQTYKKIEILVKDGKSTDNSLQYAKELQGKLQEKSLSVNTEVPTLHILEKEDTGIYDAMNQAVLEATGSMVYFLNCGDCFHTEDVLQTLVFGEIDFTGGRQILYGNIFERRTKQVVYSNPNLDAFGCYRNVPCHQACFYSKDLLLEHPFELQYKVRADYEQFLWCLFKGQGQLHYLDTVICDYEGGGFSETRENAKISAIEHRGICKLYMSGRKRLKYKMIMILTFAPIRTAIARNPKTAGFYNRVKTSLYRGK